MFVMKKTVRQNIKKPTRKIKSIDSPKSRIIAMAVVMLATFMSFFPSLNNAIDIWDDQFYIITNSLIKDLSWDGIKNIFAFVPVVGNYHPLTVLSYAIEYAIFEFNPVAYHLDNLILHLLNTLMVFIFVYKLSSRLWVAFIASILFGIHPLHVESVTWVSERKDVLYAFFFLLGLICWMNFKSNGNKKYYFFAMGLFVLSCLSKGMAVTFSIIIILIDYLQAKKVTYKILIDKIPFLVISIVFGLLAIKVQGDSSAIGFTENEVYNASDKFFFANYSLFFYIKKMLLPFELSGLYPYPIKSGGPLPFIFYFSFPANLILVFLMLYSLKRTKKVMFGSLFFIVSIFPVLQILSVGSAIAADRYFYIASIGLFYLAGLGFDNIYNNKSRATLRVFVIILSVIILSVFCVITFERTKIWKTRGTFWGDVAMKNPNLELPYLNRGIYYMTIEDKDAALADFSKALKIFPDYQDALKQRYHLLIGKGLYQEALADLNRIIRLEPDNVTAYLMIGEVYGKHLNDTENALVYLLKAYELNPNEYSVLSNLGIVYAMKGDATNAIKYFNFAKELQPNDANLLLNLSILYGNIGDTQKAEEYRKKSELAN